MQKKDIKRSQIIEHESYVSELAHYIADDLRQFRKIQGDDTLGGMVICETSEQARKLYEAFQHMPDGGQSQPIQIKMGDQVWMAAEAIPMYGTKKKLLSRLDSPRQRRQGDSQANHQGLQEEHDH